MTVETNPIFRSLLIEYHKAGRRLPWMYCVRPDGVVDFLGRTPQGIHPIYRLNTKRSTITGKFSGGKW